MPAYASTKDYKIGFRDPKHASILAKLTQRIDMAEQGTADHRARWTRNEQLYSAYVDKDAEDRAKERGTTDKGRPEYVTLYIPYSYAMLLTNHTYICSTMFARDPIWQFQGRHGEAEQQVNAMESLIAYQTTVGGHIPNYYIWTHDSLRYGFGVLGVKWCKEVVRVRRFVEQPRTFLGIPLPGKPVTVEEVEEVPSFEGNRTYNVHPADFGWDPRFPVIRFQEGEMVTRRYPISRLDILDEDNYFNQEFLGESGSNSPYYASDSFLNRPDEKQSLGMQSLVGGQTVEDKLLQAHDIYVRLIPSEWGLGKGTRPEKWFFIVLGRSLIVCARPLDSYSNMWPFAITPGEVEGYDAVPRSVLETTEALNNALSWLFNSHMYNVRAALNNQLIVDPSRMFISDLLGPNPGRLVRLKPSAYGQDVRTMWSQIATTDITRANVSDADMVANLLQRVAGINDNMMGQVNSGRRTATEARASNTMGISRTKTQVEFQSAVGYSPLAQLLVQNSQQYYAGPMKLRIVGDTFTPGNNQFINVTPEMIAGFYDLVPVDGNMPIDKLALVNTWQQFLAGMAKVPQVTAQYDLGKIFAYVGQLAGLRNIKQFQVQVLPPGVAPPQGAAPIGGVPSAPGLDNSGAPVFPQVPGGMGPVG